MPRRAENTPPLLLPYKTSPDSLQGGGYRRALMVEQKAQRKRIEDELSEYRLCEPENWLCEPENRLCAPENRLCEPRVIEHRICISYKQNT